MTKKSRKQVTLAAFFKSLRRNAASLTAATQVSAGATVVAVLSESKGLVWCVVTVHPSHQCYWAVAAWLEGRWNIWLVRLNSRQLSGHLCLAFPKAWISSRWMHEINPKGLRKSSIWGAALIYKIPDGDFSFALADDRNGGVLHD